MLAASTDDETESVASSARSPQSALQLGFLFGYPTQVESSVSLLPDKSHLPLYWRLFVQNIDPLIRIFHKPTLEALIHRVGDDPGSISPGEEALLFSFCFAVITSLSDNETSAIMGEERSALTWRYESALQQALSRAGLLDTQELVVLQAFVLMLVCCQSHEDSQILWTMIGLAIRIGEAMGLHRDGDIFRLPPLETELRRRLWWQVYILDQRAAERQGFSSKITEHLFDTELPLNINDNDISADDDVFPTPRTDCTEMSLSLVRYKYTAALCLLRNPDPLPGKRHGKSSGQTFEERKKMVEDCEKRIEEEHFKHCTHDSVVCRFTTAIGKVVIAKMWLELYHPLHNPGNDVSLTKDISDRLFVSSIEMINRCRYFAKTPETQKWAWYARAHVQWHAVAYLLAELCHRDPSPMTQRAWMTVDDVFSSFSEAIDEKKNVLRWKPLKLLRQKALQRSQRGQLASSSSSDPNTDSESYTPNSIVQTQLQPVEGRQIPLTHSSTHDSGNTWLTSAAANPSSRVVPPAGNFRSSMSMEIPASSVLENYHQTTVDGYITYNPDYYDNPETTYSTIDTAKGCQHLTALEWESLIKEMEIDSSPWAPNLNSGNLGLDLWL